MNTGDTPKPLGGIIHTYQKYDPQAFPLPTQEGPDLASLAMEHYLTFGDLRELTDEELARAVRIDPRQISGLGPSLDTLIAILEERRRKILSTYESRSVVDLAADAFRQAAQGVRPPRKHRDAFAQAVREEQIYDLERLWYRLRADGSDFARGILRVTERLGEKYQVDELHGKYEFTGHESMKVPTALAVKAELEKIDELLRQLRQAKETAQIGVIDMAALSEYAEPGDLEKLNEFQQQIESYLRDLAERQGLRRDRGAYQITPRAMRIFQGKLLERIFRDLKPSRTGRHVGPVVGDGAVELPQTRAYEFGDSPAQMDIPQTMINAMLRQPGSFPLEISAEDIEIHRTRNTPKCATAVVMDMSGSMRYNGLYRNVKRMALAIDGLIRREFPGDVLRFIEMYTFAKLCQPGELTQLLPKPVTISDPWVRLKADMSRDDMSEALVHPHFTNIQRALQLARQLLAVQNTPNRQIVLITDGLPTAHFEDHWLYLLYPPDPQTEAATMREARRCHREGITINIFLLPTWSQSREDIKFAYRMAEATQGRVFITTGKDLDRYVVWDYLARRRELIT